jgi:putative aldouronate transport system substrate-binding protein
MIFFKLKRSSLPVMRAAIAAVLFIFIFSNVHAAGQRGQQGPSPRSRDVLNMDSEMPIVNERITLSLVMPRGPSQGPSDRIWFWRWAERAMNINFDVIRLDAGTARERQNLMFATNELPDIFFAQAEFTPGEILQYGTREQQLIPLNDLIYEFAPNLNRFFRQSPAIRAQSTAPDGNIYFLPGLNLPPQAYMGARAWIHAGWLDRLGLDMPSNLDDFYNVLVAFRDRDPTGTGRRDIIPMIGGATGMPNSFNIVTAAMGFPEPNRLAPVVSPNGEVRILAANPVYAEFLRYMNRLYTEQLLDNEYYTNTGIMINAKGAELRVGVHASAAPFMMTPNEADWSQYKALRPMTSQWSNS